MISAGCMEYLRRKNPVTRLLALVLCVSWLGLLCASERPRENPYQRGEPTANGAARWHRGEMAERNSALSSWEPSAEFLAGAALSDTTEVEFPGEGEEKTSKQLVKDITVFVIVSAFVGYFLVKVFLEGDEEETPDDDGGKIIPDPTFSGSGYRGP